MSWSLNGTALLDDNLLAVHLCGQPEDTTLKPGVPLYPAHMLEAICAEDTEKELGDGRVLHVLCLERATLLLDEPGVEWFA